MLELYAGPLYGLIQPPRPSSSSSTVASGSGTFTLSSRGPNATFECRIYEAGTTPGSFSTCSGNRVHKVSGFGNDVYTFEVRAVEPFSGQEDLTPAAVLGRGIVLHPRP